ncbi:heparinase II/III family protein [Paenibacillus sp. FSL R5-0475]|uniref:heparinase II/III family protein n=1 Tax=Paenibacillus sp. FSL R5-0475 TaxID=2921643 RepID=UPI0030F63BD8
MNRQELFGIVQEMKPANLSLYYPDGESDAFWKQALLSETLKEDISEIREEAQRLDSQPISELTDTLFSIFARTGSRLEYERVYFERRRRLNTYVFMTLLEPDNVRLLENLENILWSICEEYTWCLPAHLPADHNTENIDQFIDLFSSETAFTLAEISLLLGERLPLLLRSRIRHEVEKRIFRPFIECGPYEWETARHNWAAVCAGSIGAAALLMLDDPAALTNILLKTERSMSYYLESFGDDGACLEGLSYWNYGFGYFTYYSDLLRVRSEGRVDWFATDKVRSIAQFQQKIFIGGNFVANFSDSEPRIHIHMGLSHYLADTYPEVECPPPVLRTPYAKDHCSRWAPAFRNLIWRRTGDEKQDQDWGATSYYLPDAGWLVSRYQSGGSSFGFAAKGGDNAEPHNHNDLGQFILSGGGEIYAADLGCGEYTAEYFGAGRYQYDCNGSQGHSVPIIGGQYQLAGRKHSATVLYASAAVEKDELKLELSQAYEVEELQSLIRSMVWYKGQHPRLELMDEYQYNGKSVSWTERFVTWRRPKMLRSGVVLLPGTGVGGVELTYDVQIVEPEITAREYRDHFGRDTVWHTLDFHALQPGSEGKLVFTFQFI